MTTATKTRKPKPKRRPSDNCWTDAERLAWRLPEKLTVSEWADRHRVLDPDSAAEPGKWHTSRTPHLRAIMDAFADRDVSKITLVKSTQVGGTEGPLLNCLGYAVDQDPGPTLVVMPTDNLARDFSRDRGKPLFEKSPTLAKHLPANEDNFSILRYKLARMTIWFAWSGSPATLASKPIRYLFFDETDKYPPFSGKEADPLKLGQERTRTFPNRKIVEISSPTTEDGYIWQSYESADVRLRCHIACPHCGRWQFLIFGQLKWDAEHPETARYECPHCQALITDHQKLSALQQCVWAPEDHKITAADQKRGHVPLGKHTGFWINCLYSPWLTWAEIADEWLKSQGAQNTLMNFINSWLAELWREKVRENKPEALLGNVSDYLAGQVPPAGIVLTAGVDVQQDHYFVLIRAWGLSEENWLVRAARVETWQEVEAVVFQTHYPRMGHRTEVMPVRLACIDSGYRPDDTYKFCRRWAEVARPTKGKDHLAGAPYKPSALDKDYRGKSLTRGLILWWLDTYHYKTKLTRMIQAEPGDPGQWHLFSPAADEPGAADPNLHLLEYRRQVCAERLVSRTNRRTGRIAQEWELVSAGAANHYLDCEVLAAAAADMLHVAALRETDTPIIYRPKDAGRKPARADTRDRKGWAPKHKGWMQR